ncbi:MAG: phosphodiesterase [Veillonellales bacterium]
MKIGIISDTHGCSLTWKKIFDRYLADADLIIHAGDVLYHGPRNAIPAEYDPKGLAESLNACPVPIIIAAGNCDAEVDSMVLHIPIQSPYAYVFADGLRILVNHGHKLNDQEKLDSATGYKVNLFISGHTHIAALNTQNDITLLNPGSPCMSKSKDGHGTIAVLADLQLTIFDIETGESLVSQKLKTNV